MKKKYLLLFAAVFLTITMIAVIHVQKRENVEIEYVLPDLVQLNGMLYQYTEISSETDFSSYEQQGEIIGQVDPDQWPEMDFQINRSGYLGNPVYRLDQNTAVIGYTENGVQSWHVFEQISLE